MYPSPRAPTERSKDQAQVLDGSHGPGRGCDLPCQHRPADLVLHGVVDMYSPQRQKSTYCKLLGPLHPSLVRWDRRSPRPCRGCERRRAAGPPGRRSRACQVRIAPGPAPPIALDQAQVLDGATAQAEVVSAAARLDCHRGNRTPAMRAADPRARSHGIYHVTPGSTLSVEGLPGSGEWNRRRGYGREGRRLITFTPLLTQPLRGTSRLY